MTNVKKKWAVIIGTAVLTGALATGAAFAAEGVQAKAAEKIEQAVQDGKLTQGQADVLKTLAGIREKYMEQMKAESKAVIDQAVKDGKITQEQADKMLSKGARGPHGKGPHGKGPHGKGFGAGLKGELKGLSEAEVKARLEQAVTDGKLTQEQAARMLEKWQKHQSNAQGSN